MADGGDWLSQGRHIFHFSFTLPSLLPSSYNDKYGTIEYEVSAILDQDFWSSKEITRREFKVVSDVDLNKYPEAEVLELIRHIATYRAGGLSSPLIKINGQTIVSLHVPERYTYRNKYFIKPTCPPTILKRYS